MRKYMAPTDARCPGCGVVTNVRQVAPRAAAGQGNLGGADVRTGDAGPGDDIKPVTIAGTGHYPMLEKPDEFNRLLGEILRDLGL